MLILPSDKDCDKIAQDFARPNAGRRRRNVDEPFKTASRVGAGKGQARYHYLYWRVVSHSKWRCQYHIVFAPKYRRQVIYGQLKTDIGKILRKLCEQKGVEIVEAEACPDHIHMLVCIPPSLSVAQFMGYLKGKSSLMIFDRHANLKYKYGNRHFWCRGYFVDTVGRNETPRSKTAGYRQNERAGARGIDPKSNKIIQ